jgi:HRDC domain/TgpA N-terminal domain
MKSQQLIAYILIAIGALALLARFTGGAGWLWVAIVAVALLWGYSVQKSYGLLVAGSIVMGVAVGLLLENNWGWSGAFLISLGIGFIMIDRIETRKNRWPFYVGAMLSAFGLVVGLLDSGFLGSFWFALVLIAGGAFLLSRDRSEAWVKVEPSSYQPNQNPVSQNPASQNPVSQSAMSQAQASTVATNLEADVSSNITETPDSSYKTFSSTETSMNETPETLSNSPLPHEVDQGLYTRLEQWRRETAKIEDRAAYLILTNETLQHIATFKPQNLEELLAIKGIGDIKLERYGEALLQIIGETQNY